MPRPSATGPGPIPSGSPTRRVRRRRSASEALRSEAEFLCRKSPKGFSGKRSRQSAARPCGAVIARSKAPRAAVDIGIHALAEHRRKQEFSAARGQKVADERLGRSAAVPAVLPQEGDIVILAGQAILPAAAGVGPVAEQHIPAQNDAAHCLDAGKHPKDLRLCPGQLSARKLYRPAEGAQIPTHILSPSRFPIHRESCIAARIRRYF